MFENENDDRLADAAKEMRLAAIDTMALDRAEAGIMARVPARRSFARPAIYWAAGLGTAALVLSIVLAPSKSFASELRRVAQNGDAAVRHVVSYSIESDGSLKFENETYTDGVRIKVRDQSGNQYTLIGGRSTTLYPNGSETIETRKRGRPWLINVSDIIAADTNSDRMSNVRTSIQRGVHRNGVTADEYVVDGTFRDGQNIERHSHMVLVADASTERPIEMDYELSGLAKGIAKWDYPAQDTKLFDLPVTPETRVYDIDAERRDVMDSLSEDGRKLVAFGKTIELLQVWVGGQDGEVCAIARADYAYPCNYGIEVDDLHLNTGPENGVPAANVASVSPTLYKGRLVQLFFTNRTPSDGPVPINDRVSVRIPVFDGSTFEGYAKFENVLVHRAWSAYSLLKPMNIPFWDDPQYATVPAAR